MLVAALLLEYASLKLSVRFRGATEPALTYSLADNIDRICISVCVMHEGLRKVVADHIRVFLLGIFHQG